MIGNVAARARAFGPPAASILRQVEAKAPTSVLARVSSSRVISPPPSLKNTSGQHLIRPINKIRSPYAWRESKTLAAAPFLTYHTSPPQTSAQQFSKFAFYSNIPQRRSFSDESKDVSNTNNHNSTGDASRPQPNLLNAMNTPEGKGKSLYDRLPHIGNYHRPTKEELLAAATGFWSRLKIRFKWFSIRSVRPFNSDEIGALFSWVLLGNILWIILGTTTFASLLILLFNTVFAQETLARSVGNYITKSSGVKVVFESAIVPRWRGGVITFKNVFVSRRPGQNKTKVRKGSPETVAAAAAAAAAVDHTRLQE
jgi:distribution and morphology protein 31